MTKLLPIALAITLSTPAMGQATMAQATPQPQPTAQKNDLDRMVCEKQEEIGSRLGARKVCKTVREWQEQRRIQQEEVQDQQLRGYQQKPGG